MVILTAIWVNITNEIVVTKNQNNIGSDDFVSKIALLKSFYFTNKLVLSSARAFHENSLIVACYTLCMLEVRISTPNRFKNQTNHTLILLDRNDNHWQGFVKQKTFLSIIAVLSQNFQNTFVKIAILDKLYQCNSC